MVHYPLLTAEEERQLAPANPGDTQAHQALVLHKKRYIDIVSSSSLLGSLKYSRQGLLREDLVQEGSRSV